MPRLLALEWDSREARVAVARTRGKEAVVEHVFAVELAPRDASDSAIEANVGERLAAALATRRIARCDALVGVGRTSIELRRLSLPPAPPEELPDLVRFQAMRDFTGVGEDWPLDFVPLDSASAEPNEEGSATVGVLAAVIAPKLVEQIRQTCEAAGLTPQRLVLRPFAAASLLRRARPSSECRMLVDLLSDEADLTVLIGDNVVFVRTVRLPAVEDEALVRAVLGETRRTIAAAQNQLGGRRVERVVVCGEPTRIQAIQPQLEEQLAIPIDPFDPFSAVELDGELRDRLPDRPGRFAPLLGMLQDEAAQARHDIDFLNPRRRPKPASRRRQYALIGGAVASLVLAGAYLIWDRQYALDREIRNLQGHVKELDEKVKLAAKLQAKAEDIDKFTQGDVTWLEEIKRVSEKLPPPDRVRVSQLRITALPAGGGNLLLSGNAKESKDATAMVLSLEDPQRQVIGKGSSETKPGTAFPWAFDNMTILVPPPEIATEGDDGDERETPVAAVPSSTR